MPTVTSADGTTIAYERSGSGPAIILVDGAMCYRAAGPMRPLAEHLKDHFTVYTYDRRGRGESTDTAPYAVEREVEDLPALVAEAGGKAHVLLRSPPGRALALATAAADAGVTGLALYEPPFMAEAEGGARIRDYTAAASRAARCRTPRRRRRPVHDPRRHARPGHRPACGTARLGNAGGDRADPGLRRRAAGRRRRAASTTPSAITVPTLVLAGSASPTGLRQAAKATADGVPGGGAADARRPDSRRGPCSPRGGAGGVLRLKPLLDVRCVLAHAR